MFRYLLKYWNKSLSECRFFWLIIVASKPVFVEALLIKMCWKLYVVSLKVMKLHFMHYFLYQFLQYRFVGVCIFYQLFWENSFSSLGVWYVCSVCSTLYLSNCKINHCLCKCNLVICDFVLTLWKQFLFIKTWKTSGIMKIQSWLIFVKNMLSERFWVSFIKNMKQSLNIIPKKD